MVMNGSGMYNTVWFGMVPQEEESPKLLMKRKRVAFGLDTREYSSGYSRVGCVV
jgi:hypothetical protein